MSITFEQLLTDPKYREMQYHELREFIINNDDVLPSVIYEGRQYLNLSNDKKFIAELFNHLQKLKAESEKKAEPIYGESPIISHINAIQMGALIEKVAKEFNKPVRLETLTKEEHPIQITDQKAREICAKHFNCIPNEIKILHP